MKKTISLALVASLALLAVSCDPASSPTPPPAKKVVEKIAPTEQRMSFDWMDKQSLRSRAETVYYLIAEDGTVAEVKLPIYAKTKIGDEVSADWKTPE